MSLRYMNIILFIYHPSFIIRYISYIYTRLLHQATITYHPIHISQPKQRLAAGWLAHHSSIHHSPSQSSHHESTTGFHRPLSVCHHLSRSFLSTTGPLYVFHRPIHPSLVLLCSSAPVLTITSSTLSAAFSAAFSAAAAALLLLLLLAPHHSLIPVLEVLLLLLSSFLSSEDFECLCSCFSTFSDTTFEDLGGKTNASPQSPSIFSTVTSPPPSSVAPLPSSAVRRYAILLSVRPMKAPTPYFSTTSPLGSVTIMKKRGDLRAASRRAWAARRAR